MNLGRIMGYDYFAPPVGATYKVYYANEIRTLT